jgi:hypothetical protein
MDLGEGAGALRLGQALLSTGRSPTLRRLIGERWRYRDGKFHEVSKESKKEAVWKKFFPNFLLPVRVLSKLFRRLMLTKLMAVHAVRSGCWYMLAWGRSCDEIARAGMVAEKTAARASGRLDAPFRVRETVAMPIVPVIATRNCCLGASIR